jgi:hypothetical protein
VRIALAVLACTSMFATGCQEQQPAAHVATPVASHATPAVVLHCSLPVIALRTAGFVDFPSGTFRPDRSAPADLLSGGYVYAWGIHRWVKAPFNTLEYQALSPDGTELAVLEPPTRSGYTNVAVVDLASGASRHVGELGASAARIISFQRDGIYLTAGLVFRMDATTGAVTVIGPYAADAGVAGPGAWSWVTSSAVWYSLLPAPNQAAENSILSVSVTDGKLQKWYTAPASRAVSIVGFVTPSEPLAVEYGNDASHKQLTDLQFMLLTAPGTTRRLDFGPSLSPAPWGMSDATGVWLSTGGHLWLYDERGLESMADISAAVGQGVSATPLGPCH